AAVMDRQVEHMVRLIDDLLDVSRVARGKLRLRKERVELGAVVAAAIEASGPHIEGAGHEFTAKLSSAAIHLDADPVRLAQVIANLLNNAAKYTPRSGRIWLTTEAHNGRATVSVRDNGIGIAAEHLPHMFNLFFQVDTA